MSDPAPSPRPAVEVDRRIIDDLDHRIIDQLHAAVCVCSAPLGEIVRYNRLAVELWGRRPEPGERFTGAWRLRSLEGRLVPADQTPMADVLRGGPAVADARLIVERRDLTEVIVSMYVAPLTDAQGKLVGAANVFKDISTRQRADAEQTALNDALIESHRRLHEKDAQLNLVLESALIGVCDYDLKTMRAVRSSRHDQIYGYTELLPEWTLRTFLDHVSTEHRELAWTQFQKCLTTGEGEFECRIRRADGTHAWIWWRAKVLRDPKGAPARMMGVVMDITERKHTAQLLSEAARRKDDFVSTLAHELRQPLSPILAAVEVMRLGISPESHERAHQVVVRQVGQINRLVEDLVEATRWARGNVTLEKSRIDLRRVLEDAANDVAPALKERGHQFIISNSPDAVWLEADGGRLQQVLSNLLRNAVKYTDPGGCIWLSLEHTASLVTLTVRDTGLGIQPDLIDSVFELFAQVSPHDSNGLGVGLSVVRQIVGLHGGRVEARSAGVGYGSEFIVTLPVVREAADA
jgi:PAS domain S-box-containing protein